MNKTSEYIKIVLINGNTQKRYIYLGENGEKYIYNQNSFWKLEDFVKNREIIYHIPTTEVAMVERGTEMNIADYISLTEYARLNGITPITARQRAERGAFKTAQKIGRNWVIDKNEPLVDHRKRKEED